MKGLRRTPRTGGAGEAPDDRLPFARFWPLSVGVLVGLGLRLAFFGEPGDRFAAMTAAFIFVSPVLVGAVTVYIAEFEARRSWSYYFWAGFIANCFYVIGTLVILLEGLICAVVILPLFAVVGGLAGLAMGGICRLTHLPRSTIPSLAVLPFLVAFVEDGVKYDVRMGSVERTVMVNASPDVVWKQILNARDIKPEEIEDAWFFRIGVPLVHSGVMTDSSVGSVRRVTMGKNVYFDEVITDLQAPNYIRWTHRYFEDSFPKYALDDHVKLGGHYFDVTGTAFSLTARGAQTAVKIQMGYRVSTSFNWYADPVARVLLENLAGINLDFYKRRSERLIETAERQ